MRSGRHCTTAGSAMPSRAVSATSGSSAAAASVTRPRLSSRCPSAAIAYARDGVGLHPLGRLEGDRERRARLRLAAEVREHQRLRGHAERQQPDLARLLGERERLRRPRHRLAPAPAPEVEMRPRGERVDQRDDRARVAVGAHEPREDRLGAVELLRPDRAVPGHAEHLGRREHRVAAAQERVGDPQQLLAGAALPEREVGLADHDHREQLERRVAALGDLAGPVGGADQRGHVARAHREDRRLEVHRGGAQRVGPARRVGLRDQRVVGVRVERGADADVRPPAPDLGVGERVGAAVLGRPQVGERLLALADRGRVARGLEEPPRARASLPGDRSAARARSRAAVPGAPRRRASSPAASSAAATSSSGAIVAEARCHARPALPGAATSASARWTIRRSSARGGVVGGRAQQRVAEVEPPAAPG